MRDEKIATGAIPEKSKFLAFLLRENNFKKRQNELRVTF